MEYKVQYKLRLNRKNNYFNKMRLQGFLTEEFLLEKLRLFLEFILKTF